jgi:hypothetical protein
VRESRREQRRASLRDVLLSAGGSCERQIARDWINRANGMEVFTLDCTSAHMNNDVGGS